VFARYAPSEYDALIENVTREEQRDKIASPVIANQNNHTIIKTITVLQKFKIIMVTPSSPTRKNV